MTSFAKSKAADEVEYPSSDGKPMAETEIHSENMTNVVHGLKREYYLDVADVYVGSNMLMYYEPGDKHKHVSPDVFVVLGIEKCIRKNFLVWKEGKAPDLVIEFTSASTKREDVDTKFKLYRDVLKVREYFLFDPHAEYLEPSFQGFRLVAGRYVKIRSVAGRLPSKVLGLHLERAETLLRLFNPVTGKWLLTPAEEVLARQEAERGRQQEALARQEAEQGWQQETLARQELEAELEKVRQKLAAFEENDQRK